MQINEKYFPADVEKAAQQFWQQQNSAVAVDNDLSKPKYYPNLTFYCIEYQ